MDKTDKRVQSNEFTKLMDIGGLIETKVKKYFKTLGYEVEDLSTNPEYMTKDVDFRAKKGVLDFLIEVKGDTRVSDTGNIIIEMGMLRGKGMFKKGWFHYCEADILCYHDIEGDRGWLIDWKKLKKEVLDFYNIDLFANKSDNCMGSIIKLPFKDLEKNKWLIHEYKI